MFERYSGLTRDMLVGAQELVRQTGACSIRVEHILLAIIARDGSIAELFFQRGITSALERRSRSGATGTPRGHIPFADEAKGCIQLVRQEADFEGRSWVGLEEILLAVLSWGQENPDYFGTLIDCSELRLSVERLIEARKPQTSKRLTELASLGIGDWSDEEFAGLRALVLARRPQKA